MEWFGLISRFPIGIFMLFSLGFKAIVVFKEYLVWKALRYKIFNMVKDVEKMV